MSFVAGNIIHWMSILGTCCLSSCRTNENLIFDINVSITTKCTENISVTSTIRDKKTCRIQKYKVKHELSIKSVASSHFQE